MKVDYIIVGLGIAGIAFCEKLMERNKRFVVFDAGNNSSSKVAAGLYNPVILKRFTPVWNALEQINKALPLYANLESKLGVTIDFKTPVQRLFYSVDEQNRWFEASDKPLLEPFILPKIHPNTNQQIKADFGLGEVLQSGRIDTFQLVEAYRNFLLKKQLVKEEVFEYTTLQLTKPLIYKTIQTQHIVFAEGFGMKKNPFFNYLPLVGNKGELLLIKAPHLKLKYILKSGIFIIPLGKDTYKVGATYNWNDKNATPTQEAKEELIGKLRKMIACEFEIIAHQAGVRPTVIDRKPLVGQHSEFKNLYVLNGLGTHGVLIGPTVAENLYDFIEHGKQLDTEINITRFH